MAQNWLLQTGCFFVLLRFSSARLLRRHLSPLMSISDVGPCLFFCELSGVSLCLLFWVSAESFLNKDAAPPRFPRVEITVQDSQPYKTAVCIHCHQTLCKQIQCLDEFPCLSASEEKSSATQLKPAMSHDDDSGNANIRDVLSQAECQPTCIFAEWFTGRYHHPPTRRH